MEEAAGSIPASSTSLVFCLKWVVNLSSVKDGSFLLLSLVSSGNFNCV
jgi:hypothetical protein